eukprot:jgi/Ulvmu1/2279/UM013_0126.1
MRVLTTYQKLRADWRRPGNLLQSDTCHTFINCSRSSATSHLATFSPIQRARAVPDMGTIVAAASFTPLPALMGGACIGMLSSGKTLITGRILGISGAIKGLFGGDTSSWRALFLGGLLAGGGLVAWLMPGSIDVLPATFTFTRAIAAGLMVGAGAALGNGCTSGHGIAGNARLSLRSFVYTCVFFAAGIAVSIAAQTPDALGVARVQPPYAGLTSMQLTHGLGLVAAAATTTAVAGIAAKRTKSTLPSLAYEFTAGLLFALALGFSQMTRPTVVSTALAFFQPYWNWTLFFVMGGALAVAVPAFQLVILRRERALSGAAIGCPPPPPSMLSSSPAPSSSAAAGASAASAPAPPSCPSAARSRSPRRSTRRCWSALRPSSPRRSGMPRGSSSGGLRTTAQAPRRSPVRERTCATADVVRGRGSPAGGS